MAFALPALRAYAQSMTLAASVALGLVAVAEPTASAAGPRPLFKPLLLPSDNYGETFTFIADLEDGSYAVVQLGVTNLGPGSGHGLCHYLVVPPVLQRWAGSARMSAEQWNYFGAPDDRLKIGNCTLASGPGGVRAEAGGDGGHVALGFKAQPVTLEPPLSRLRLERSQYRSEILFAGATVTATITLPEQKTQVLRGNGYADHSCSDVAPNKLARNWVRFRALRADPPLLILGRQDNEGAFAPVWQWRGGHFENLRRFALDRTGMDEGTKFTVGLGTARELVIKSERLLIREAPVEELGIAGVLIKPFVGSPVTYTYRAELNGRGRPPVAGILEVEIQE